MTCRFCGWHNNRHDENCPEGDKKAEVRWRVGNNAGHNGLENSMPDDPIFTMGFLQGVVAKEEVENGYRPGVDGGQW